MLLKTFSFVTYFFTNAMISLEDYTNVGFDLTLTNPNWISVNTTVDLSLGLL